MITSHLRRRFLLTIGGSILFANFGRRFVSARTLPAGDSENGWSIGGSNFHAIYDNEQLSNSFLNFLKNVYSILPADRFHALIAEITKTTAHDKDIYLASQGRLPEIKPIASEVRNALPALFHQTEIVGNQLRQLLEGRETIDGYMEIGSKGGYIAYARPKLTLKGDVVLLNTDAASYGIRDMFERRGLLKVGRFVSLNSYAPINDAEVETGSLDVVCNPIGFHHSPPEYRDEFVRSIRRCLRSGGELIVRDHDVDSPEMNHLVALAHDVFNMGIDHTWDYNKNEIRNFTSLQALCDYLTRFGFRSTGKIIYQDGDPTRNALMSFIAV